MSKSTPLPTGTNEVCEPLSIVDELERSDAPVPPLGVEHLAILDELEAGPIIQTTRTHLGHALSPPRTAQTQDASSTTQS